MQQCGYLRTVLEEEGTNPMSSEQQSSAIAGTEDWLMEEKVNIPDSLNSESRGVKTRKVYIYMLMITQGNSTGRYLFTQWNLHSNKLPWKSPSSYLSGGLEPSEVLGELPTEHLP